MAAGARPSPLRTPHVFHYPLAEVPTRVDTFMYAVIPLACIPAHAVDVLTCRPLIFGRVRICMTILGPCTREARWM